MKPAEYPPGVLRAMADRARTYSTWLREQGFDLDSPALVLAGNCASMRADNYDDAADAA